MSKATFRFLSAFLALGMVSALGACGGGETFYDPRDANQISVRKEISTLVLKLDGDGTLPAVEAVRLDAFLTAFETKGEAPIEIAVRSIKEDEPKAKSQALAVAQLLLNWGIRAKDVAVTINQVEVKPPDAGAGMILSYGSYRAVLPECGDWTKSATYTPTNASDRNSGCSVTRNIGAMAANPRDLIRMQDGDRTIDPVRAAGVMGKFRAGEATPADGKVTTSTRKAE